MSAKKGCRHDIWQHFGDFVATFAAKAKMKIKRQEIQPMVQQRKGDKAQRSKEAAALLLREISLQLRIKGELAPIGGLRDEAS